MDATVDFVEAQVPPALASLTPLQALARVASRHAGDVALLHSGAGEGCSVLGFGAIACVEDEGPQPLAKLDRELGKRGFSADHALVGWIGFISYDVGATLEQVRAAPRDKAGWPLVRFVLFQQYLVFERGSGRVRAFCREGAEIDWSMLADHALARTGEGGARVVKREERRDYLEKIRRVKEYIAAGDVYQANLAQKWVVATAEEPVQVFLRLCDASPAPYAAYLRFGEGPAARHVLSASPEMFIVAEQGHLLTRPIKGTRRRANDQVEDGRMRDDLLASPKDRAELAMIVDLLRNDLGRVSRFGSVVVTEPRAFEQHATVWHTVATIQSELRPGVGLGELLAAVCPGGSITGAPKIRAMQIIDELEGFSRGLYCGNIGVIGSRGERMALNIAIRTILMQHGRAYVYAGGGIVADSEADGEYDEILHKAAAMFRALAIPEREWRQ